MTTQTLSFQMHDNLLDHVVRKQAGTFVKALTEGTMNAIEAKATCLSISFDENGAKADQPGAIAILSDDGQGFNTQQEIVEHFGTFGAPHNASEQKVWAQFRIGRGQMLAMGRNIWRTNTFEMDVDISKGYTYKFKSKLPQSKGCKITIQLYHNPIGNQCASLRALAEAYQTSVRFVKVKTTFNGVNINADPDTLKWSMQDDYAYYMFDDSSEVLVYNLGIFVKAIPAWEAGVGGIVVSKKLLNVNFARNDVIMNDCSVFAHINSVLRKNRKNNVRKHRKWVSDDERISTLMDLRDNLTLYRDIKNIGLFITTSRHKISLDKIRAWNGKWTFAPVNDIVADKLWQGQQALCLDKSILAQLHYNGKPKNFFSWLTGEINIPNSAKIRFGEKFKTYCDFENILASFDERYQIVPENQYTQREKRVIRVLMDIRRCYNRVWCDRTIGIGLSSRANAWTDGSTCIYIERKFLNNYYPSSIKDARVILAMLTHEMCHDYNSAGTHVHGEDFYRAFHDMMMNTDYDKVCPMNMVAELVNRLTESRADEIILSNVKARRKREKELGINV
ncbi:MAG: hypothetical protein Q8P20_09965 [bacterium]|nr:hypothetical protein [bacterium]